MPYLMSYLSDKRDKQFKTIYNYYKKTNTYVSNTDDDKNPFNGCFSIDFSSLYPQIPSLKDTEKVSKRIKSQRNCFDTMSSKCLRHDRHTYFAMHGIKNMYEYIEKTARKLKFRDNYSKNANIRSIFYFVDDYMYILLKRPFENDVIHTARYYESSSHIKFKDRCLRTGYETSSHNRFKGGTFYEDI